MLVTKTIGGLSWQKTSTMAKKYYNRALFNLVLSVRMGRVLTEISNARRRLEGPSYIIMPEQIQAFYAADK
jgi:hypothetical protein